MPDKHDILDDIGAFGGKEFDVPERRCSCCGRMFQPTTMRGRLCRGCFTDSTKHEHWHSHALGER